MASGVDKVQSRLQEAIDQGNQASLGQAIDASKGVNGLKQLRRSAKARLKQLSADQNRQIMGSHMAPEEPLTWRTSEQVIAPFYALGSRDLLQGGRYRAVAHLPTSIIGWVIGHKGCNARMLKQQTGTELWVDVPGQCVIIEAKAAHEVDGAMDAVNSFVKTAPTFIAKVQAGGGGGVTQTVQCPVHLLPSIQRLSRKIQAESGANCVFANCKMSTFCVTGDRKNVDTAVSMLKRLIAEGNSEVLAASSNAHINAASHLGLLHGNASTQPHGHGERRGMLSGGGRGPGDMGHRLARVGSDMSRSDGSPPTAPCSPETTSASSAWGGGGGPQVRAWNAHQPLETPSAMLANSIPHAPGSLLPQRSQLPSHCPVSAPATPGGPAPFQGASGAGPSSDLSFFSFGVSAISASPSTAGGAPATRASTAPTPAVSGGAAAGLGGGSSILPGLGFLEESAGAGGRVGYENEGGDDERRASSCCSGEFGGGEAHGFPAPSRQAGSAGSLRVGTGGGGAGVSGGGGGSGCPLEGNIEDLLEELGLSKYLPVFQSAEVDLPTLCIMSEQDFRELGILKGPRVKIMHHIGSR